MPERDGKDGGGLSPEERRLHGAEIAEDRRLIARSRASVADGDRVVSDSLDRLAVSQRLIRGGGERRSRRRIP